MFCLFHTAIPLWFCDTCQNFFSLFRGSKEIGHDIFVFHKFFLWIVGVASSKHKSTVIIEQEFVKRNFLIRKVVGIAKDKRDSPASEGELFEPRTYFPQISDLNGQMLNFHVRRMQYKFAFQPFLCSILWDFCVGLNKRIWERLKTSNALA